MQRAAGLARGVTAHAVAALFSISVVGAIRSKERAGLRAAHWCCSAPNGVSLERSASVFSMPQTARQRSRIRFWLGSVAALSSPSLCACPSLSSGASCFAAETEAHTEAMTSADNQIESPLRRNSRHRERVVRQKQITAEFMELAAGVEANLTPRSLLLTQARRGHGPLPEMRNVNPRSSRCITPNNSTRCRSSW